VRVVFRQSRFDQVNRSGPNIWYTLGAKDYIVIWGQLFGDNVWDAVADCVDQYIDTQSTRKHETNRHLA
jgi:hypothetical protein